MKRKLVITMKASEFPNNAVLVFWFRYYAKLNVQVALEYFA